MFNKELTIKVGTGNYEGKDYTYLYTEIYVNDVLTEIKLKPMSKVEKDILLNYLKVD